MSGSCPSQRSPLFAKLQVQTVPTVAACLCCVLAFPHQEAEPVSPSFEHGPLDWFPLEPVDMAEVTLCPQQQRPQPAWGFHLLPPLAQPSRKKGDHPEAPCGETPSLSGETLRDECPHGRERGRGHPGSRRKSRSHAGHQLHLALTA